MANENKKKKRRCVNRFKSRVNLLCVVLQMWADIKTKEKTLSQLSVKDYNQANIIGNVGIDDLMPYITQNDCPTLQQICELRTRLSMKSQSQSKQAKVLSEFTESDLHKELSRRRREKGQMDIFGNKY